MVTRVTLLIAWVMAATLHALDFDQGCWIFKQQIIE
jgi:hypothetical protein